MCAYIVLFPNSTSGTTLGMLLLLLPHKPVCPCVFYHLMGVRVAGLMTKILLMLFHFSYMLCDSSSSGCYISLFLYVL